MEDLSFSYKFRISRVIWAIVVIACAAAFCVYMAIYNTKDISLYSLIYLSPSQARILLWCMTGVLVFAVLVAFFRLLAGMLEKHERTVRLAEESIFLPVPSMWKREVREIPYRTIRQIHVIEVHRQVQLRIAFVEGQASIARIMFRSNEEFAELVRALSDRLSARP